MDTSGAISCFSFYPAKALGCFGDGGALVTNDDRVAERIELWRDHGRNKDGIVVDWGTNCRLDNVQAAILNFKLKSFDAAIARRREIARIYDRRLKGVRDLILPPGPDSDPDHFDVFQNFEIQSGHRDELRAFLEQRGVRTLLQWGGRAVHQFKELGFSVALPKTALMTSRFIMLPMNTSLSDDDANYVCDSIAEFYSKG